MAAGSHLRGSVRVVLAIVLAALLLGHIGRAARGRPAAPRRTPPGVREACGTENPYLVTACYVIPTGSKAVADRSAVLVAFRDKPADNPQYHLASNGEVGAIYGLAYSAQEHAVYAAAYHRRQLLFGPGGPGAIYRYDLATEDLAHWATVPDPGDDQHDGRFAGRDLGAGKWAGKTSLGDIDLSDEADELYVVNLHDRHIYRLAVPSGDVIGRFSHGATAEAWAEEARPFGLAYRKGRVYHGVVRSGESTGDRDDLHAYVYSSAPDGSDMREAASVGLQYARGILEWNWLNDQEYIPLEWEAWTDDPPRTAGDAQYVRAHPMPMLTDIEFDAEGNLIIGLGDRMLDVALLQGWVGGDYVAIGAGDTLRGTPKGAGYEVEPIPEHFDDKHRVSDEFTLGGLAAISWLDQIVTNGWADIEVNQRLLDNEGVYWFDARTGRTQRKEGLCSRYGAAPRALLELAPVALADDEGPPSGHTGDVELLCPRPQAPTPTVTASALPTATSTRGPTNAPTATGTRRPTPTTSPAPSPTVTATLTPGPIHLPLALREHCDPLYQRADVALIMDTSSSMLGTKLDQAKEAALLFASLMDLAPGRDQVAVIRFDADAEVTQPLTHDRRRVEAAISRLESRRGTHIDSGLHAALAELESDRRIAANTPIAILMTDGAHNGEPGADRAAADHVRDAGARLYSIGLGSDVDADALREMAGDDRRYYFAPNAADLSAIYAEIAQDITCPPEQFWGNRP